MTGGLQVGADSRLSGVEMVRDGEREAARLLAADRLVFQFPIQWYSTPALLKA